MSVTAERSAAPSRRDQRRGSSVSDRQVAHAVKNGRKVTATLVTGDTVTGYVMGADDYHWAMTADDGRIVLVHKSSPSLHIHADSTLDTESEATQKMVAPYRDLILREYFNQTPPADK